MIGQGTPVIAVTVGGDELEALSVREILSLTHASSLVPHGLESQLSSRAKVSVAPNMDGLDVVPTLDFLITVKLD